MRTFLPDDPPEPPSVDQDCNSTHPPGSTDTSSSAATNTGSGQQASDDTLTAGERSNSSRAATGAVEGGNDGGSGGNGSSSRNNGGGGRAGSPSSSNISGSGGSSFVDEAAAGGAGLVLSSPRQLEPFLSPSSLSASQLMANRSSAEVKSAAEVTTVEAAAGEIAGLGVGNGSSVAAGATATATAGASSPFVSSAAGMLPSKYPVGTSGSGGAMGSDERLWLVYEGVSASGKGVVSKVNAPDPYWLGRAPPGAVCPHQHSMEFYSSFESSNLLRAVQVRTGQDSSLALKRAKIHGCCDMLFQAYH